MPSPAIYTTTPTVRTDGQHNTALSSALISLRIEEDRFSGRHGVLEVRNWTLDGAGKPSFPATVNAHRIGTRIEVLFGDVVVFSGRIVGHDMRYLPSQSPTAGFLLADEIALMHRDIRYRVFDDMSLADIAATAANDRGLMVETVGETPMFSRLEQRGQSTWELLAEQLERFGLYWRLEDDTIHLAPQTEHSSDQASLAFGESLVQFEARADATLIPTQGKSAHWNPQTGHRKVINVSKAQLDLGNAGGKSGSEVSQAALGTTPLIVDNAATNAEANATTATRAAFQQAVDGFMVAQAVATAQPELRVGAHVAISGVDDWSAGGYSVSSLTHVFDQQHGARTELVLERPTIGYSSVKRVPKGRSTNTPSRTPTRRPIRQPRTPTARRRRRSRN